MLTQTSRLCLGDVFKSIDHPAICLTSGIFRNNTGTALAAGTALIAQPVKLSSGKWVPVLAGDEANVGGLLYTQAKLGVALANNTDFTDVQSGKVAVLTLGPAILLTDALPALDVAGGTLNWTTLETALRVIDKHIVFVDAPPTQYTQTFD